MLILASSSPRRRTLIDVLGAEVSCVASTVDEGLLSEAGSPADFVIRAAVAKASDVAQHHRDAVVIGCDTVVVHDGRRLGKPLDQADAERTLRAMNGAVVEISTGLAIVSDDPGGRYEATRLVTCECQMASVADDVLAEYLASGIWRDKAGSLAVQHQDPSLVDSVDGCVPNALGLPLCELATMLLDAPVGADERAQLSAFGCGVDRSACPVAISTLAGT